MNLYFDHFESPLGLMEIAASECAVKSIYFVDAVTPKNPNSITTLAKGQLLAYFDGALKTFDLPLEADGTVFQKTVWNALTTIVYAQTCTYGDIAKQIGNPKGMRAVGLANGKNPMTIVVPCHRVIGANGKLTGYASGTDRKAWLLNHERDWLF
ncbi:MAG: methylated-DNA--[protein]-cysteine S-methyltransferase [Arenicella sp.]|nr:methylated-DNA--[protein]-cysteine S-methyltransferase [Arenicella sp.]